MSPNSNHSEPRQREFAAQVAAPLRRFMQTETGSAALLLAAAVLALAWANGPFADSYTSFWGTELSIDLGQWGVSLDLRHWLDEGLMALFFFVIGLEVRRELSIGELTERSRVAIPIAAGIGGMILPTLIFLLIAPSGEAAQGWGIVIATDTAFMLGALALVGPRISTQLRIFLLTLAIVDDVVAISIIGLVYSDTLDPIAIAVATAALAGIAALSHFQVKKLGAYLVTGTILWVATLESGLHPTLAGMLAGLLVVAYAPRREEVERAAKQARAFRQSPLPSVARSARRSVEQAISPNERLQVALLPVTGYVIVPLFALANAGVDLRGGALGEALSSPLTWAVVAGLVLGKAVGISAAGLGAVRAGLGRLPQGVGGGQVVGGAALSGIGFTVSVLIAGLAFESDELQAQAKVGILIAAVLAVGLGWIGFRLAAIFRGEVDATLPLVLDRPVDPDRDHIRGRIDAPYTLVEYGDFECPFCGKSTGMVRELRARFGDDLRYVFRHLVLIDVHPHAELAAEASEAAGSQGRFWEMHDLLFAHQGDLDIEDLIGYAGRLDLDVDLFVAEIEQGVHAERVRQDVISAELSGARGTPTFFVGESRLTGAYDAATLERELRASGD